MKFFSPFGKHILISICNRDTAISGFSSGDISLGKTVFSQLSLPSSMLKAWPVCNLELQSKFYQMMVCFPAPSLVKTALVLSEDAYFSQLVYGGKLQLIQTCLKKVELRFKVWKSWTCEKSHIEFISLGWTELHLFSLASTVCLLLRKKDISKYTILTIASSLHGRMYILITFPR